MARLLEIVLLICVCLLAYFPGLGRYSYIKTESLRAVVVDEMLGRDGLTLPTVHGTPYIKKPPLYAWTTTELARLVGRFDEGIARLPVAICGMLLVLLIYVLAVRWIGPAAGLPAAVFSLLNPTIADYSVRAELDLPFSFFCIASIACGLTAVRKETGRGTATLCWLGAYLLALIAAMWKAPHSLVFLWLALIGHARMSHDWSFLRRLAQWLGLAAVLAVLVAWYLAISRFAGAAEVGRTAAIELFIRLVPHRLSHLARIVGFVPEVVIISIPASVFAILTFSGAVRIGCGWSERILTPPESWFQRTRASLGAWWTALRNDSIGLLLLAWLIPNLIFLGIAQGKAPRYTIPIFVPIILLGALVVVRLDGAGADSEARRHCENVWRVLFAVLGFIGAGALICSVSVLAGDLLGPLTHNWPAWAVMFAGCGGAFFVHQFMPRSRRLRPRMLLLLCVLLSAQPVLDGVWWPRRAAADSQRAVAERIELLTGPDETVFVLGHHEYPDTQIYAHRRFLFVDSIDRALDASDRSRVYCIARGDELEAFIGQTTAPVREVFRFERADSDSALVVVERPAA